MVNDVELGLGERFSAGLDIIIGMPNTEVHIADFTKDDVVAVYAQTSSDDPFTLSIEGPGTLDGLIGDGAPSDAPLVDAVDAVTAADSNFKPLIVDNGGSIITDDAATTTGAPSDASVNAILVADTNDDGTAFTYAGGAGSDLFILTNDIVTGDTISAGEGFDVLDLTYAYDASNEGNQGITVDLGFGTVELNDGTEISILNSGIESFSGTHQDDHFYGTSSDAYSTLNTIQSFAFLEWVQTLLVDMQIQACSR